VLLVNLAVAVGLGGRAGLGAELLWGVGQGFGQGLGQAGLGASFRKYHQID
jgi:hypothetical protein